MFCFSSNLIKSIDVAFQTQSYKGSLLDIESTCLCLADWVTFEIGFADCWYHLLVYVALDNKRED